MDQAEYDKMRLKRAARKIQREEGVVKYTEALRIAKERDKEKDG